MNASTDQHTVSIDVFANTEPYDPEEEWTQEKIEQIWEGIITDAGDRITDLWPSEDWADVKWTVIKNVGYMPSGEREEPIWNSNFEDGDTLYITAVVSDTVPDPQDPIETITTYRTPAYIGHVDNVHFGAGYSRTDLNAKTKQEILDLGASLGYEMETTSSNTKDEIIEDFLACQYDAI